MQTKKIKKILSVFFVISFSGFLISIPHIKNNKKQTKKLGFNNKINENNKYGAFLSSFRAGLINDYNKLYLSYDNAVKQNNNDFLGRSFILNTSLQNKEESLKQALIEHKKDKENIVPIIYISNIYFLDGQYDKSLEFLSKINKNKANFIVNLLKSWNFVAQKKYDKALDLINLYKENRLFKKYVYMNLAFIYEISGKTKLIEKNYKKALETNNLNLFDIEIIVSFYLKNNNKKEAIKIIEDYYNKKPDSVSITSFLNSVKKDIYKPISINTAQKGMAIAIFDIGSIFNNVLSSPLDLYLMHLNMAINMYPEFYMAKLVKSEVYKRINWIDEFNKEALKIPDSHYLNLINKLNQAEFLNKNNKSLDIYEKLTEKYPDIAYTYLNMGEYYKSKENFDEAIKYYSKAIENTKKETLLSDIYFKRAQTYDLKGNLDKAEKDLEEAYNLDKSKHDLLNYYGYFLIEKNKTPDEKTLNKGTFLITEALKKQPSNPYYLDSYGWVLFKSKDYEGATVMLELAKSLQPSNPVIINHLGDLYLELGRNKEAVFEWNKALKFEKTNKNPNEIIDIIAIQDKINKYKK